mmetsp:Transcript_23719/g.74191  ORF Transcript_23719/g.74191 Transcript_23719/m.74191 type:complete len:96 (-) Transcript_23719:163-450(-)
MGDITFLRHLDLLNHHVLSAIAAAVATSAFFVCVWSRCLTRQQHIAQDAAHQAGGVGIAGIIPSTYGRPAQQCALMERLLVSNGEDSLVDRPKCG